MSAKNRDNKNRWRNITVGFRVSPEENELINKAVALSGHAEAGILLPPLSESGCSGAGQSESIQGTQNGTFRCPHRIEAD